MRGAVPVALLAVVSLAGALAGCGGAAPPPAGPAPSAGATVLPAKAGGPLTRLPACRSTPPAVGGRVPGLVLPDRAVVTKVTPSRQFVTVTGYAPVPPVVVRQFYQRRAGWQLYMIEDEITEAEVLLGTATHRSYVKARAVCATGSTLLAVVAPEVAGSTLPTVGSGRR
jgi:hypothetical protein